MFKHYLTTALRNFRQQKFTTALNIACLAFGLMCFLGVYGLIAYLQGSDRHIPGVDRIFSVSQSMAVPGSDSLRATMPMTSWPVAKLLQADFPQLDAVTQLTSVAPTSSGDSLKSATAGMDAKVRFADGNLLNVLRLPLLAGDSQALHAPKSIVLSDAAAIRLFGSADRALGGNVVLFGSTSLTVTGVLDTVPQPSHLSTAALSNPFQRFDVLVSMDVYEARQKDPEALQSWDAVNVATYVVLPRNGSLTVDELRNQLPAFVKRHAPTSRVQVQLGLMPLSNVTLSYFESGLRFMRSGIGSVALLYMLGGLVLLIACLNYANLATAQAATRAKEIGLRRVVGATRLQVMTQYLLEAGLASVTAAIIALSLLSTLSIVLPVFNQALDVAHFFIRNLLPSWQLWITLLATLGAVTLTAGAYPAFVLSNVRPLHAVRGGKEKSSRRKITGLIVGVQFMSASFLFISILVMQSQSNYIRNASFATLADPVLVLANYSDSPVKYETLRAELLRQPHVKSVTASSAAPWEIHNMNGTASISDSFDPQARRRPALRNFDAADFFTTLEFKLLAGRLLSNEQALDDANVASQTDGALTNVVVDRTFASEHNWSPMEAIGKTVYYWRNRNGQDTARPLAIVGVVEAKPLSVIQFGVNANVYFLNPAANRAVIVRISQDDVRAGVREVDAAWDRVAPTIAIQRQFADQALNSAMWMVDALSSVFRMIAAAAIVIAMLGLIGVSMHATHRRMHEIGVRKTLGASSRRIFSMLLKDFSKPVLIANLIAWPLAYVLMRAYLSIFTQATGLNAVPFLISFSVTLLAAWLSISAQVMRAARLSPATVLRYE